MHESYQIWMHLVTCEWVMTHMNGSWHIWMSHGTYEWAMAHMNESWHIWMSRGTYEWVMAHMNESWHIWMSHDPWLVINDMVHACCCSRRSCGKSGANSHMNESCHLWIIYVAYEWVMARDSYCITWCVDVVAGVAVAARAARTRWCCLCTR